MVATKLFFLLAFLSDCCVGENTPDDFRPSVRGPAFRGESTAEPVVVSPGDSGTGGKASLALAGGVGSGVGMLVLLLDAAAAPAACCRKLANDSYT